MEDPLYYDLRNTALDFLYNRFAHDEWCQLGMKNKNLSIFLAQHEAIWLVSKIHNIGILYIFIKICQKIMV
jgi:hypothetical protein